MKRKPVSFLLVVGLCAQLAGCQLSDATVAENPESGLTGQWLLYHETQCADPWGYCNKDPNKLTCVKEHLANLGVTVLEASVGGQGHEMVCQACQCTTGRIFNVKVNTADVDKVLAAGFKKP